MSQPWASKDKNISSIRIKILFSLYFLCQTWLKLKIFNYIALTQSSREQSIFPSLHTVKLFIPQRAKKVLSDSPGLVDFAIGLVNSVFNLPDGQVMFYEEFE